MLNENRHARPCDSGNFAAFSATWTFSAFQENRAGGTSLDVWHRWFSRYDSAPSRGDSSLHGEWEKPSGIAGLTMRAVGWTPPRGSPWHTADSLSLTYLPPATSPCFQIA